MCVCECVRVRMCVCLWVYVVCVSVYLYVVCERFCMCIATLYSGVCVQVCNVCVHLEYQMGTQCIQYLETRYMYRKLGTQIYIESVVCTGMYKYS